MATAEQALPSVDVPGGETRRAVAFRVGADTLRQDYFVDCRRFVAGRCEAPSLAAPAEREDDPGEEDATGASKETKAKKKRRRRDELEEYDLADPFIDDTELPAGFSLFELLTGAAQVAGADADDDSDEEDRDRARDGGGGGGGEGEGEGGGGRKKRGKREKDGLAVPKSEYYVWKGRLPERTVDPLWAEKVEVKQRRQRRRRNETGTKVETESGTGIESEKRAETRKKRKMTESNGPRMLESSPRKRTKASKGTDETRTPRIPKSPKDKIPKSPRDKIPRSPRDKKKTKRPEQGSDQQASVIDRIAMLGDADADAEAIDVGSKEADRQGTSETAVAATEGVVEEKTRKKIDSTRPFLELEHRLAMAAFRAEAEKTAFADPKKFPSHLRPPCNEAIVTGMRLVEKKTSLPVGLLDSISAFLPFPVGSLEKLLCAKVVPLYRDELRVKTIPELMTTLKTEIASLYQAASGNGAGSGGPIEGAGAGGEGGGGGGGGGGGKRRPRWNERIRELVSDLVRHELDWQSLDRLALAYAGLKADPFSEITIRKALYPRIASCWPAGEMATMELGKEYSMWRRKMELRKLKEHGIEVTPTLVPIQSKSRLVERAEAPSLHPPHNAAGTEAETTGTGGSVELPMGTGRSAELPMGTTSSPPPGADNPENGDA